MTNIVLQLICVAAGALLLPAILRYSKRDPIKFEICCWILTLLGLAIVLLT